MKCYACDCLLAPSSGLDMKTGRYYCDPCLEPTYEVILNQELYQADKDYGSELVDRLGELQEDAIPYEEFSEDDPFEE